jgi:DNA-binding NarL/FixJ family response regulator
MGPAKTRAVAIEKSRTLDVARSRVGGSREVGGVMPQRLTQRELEVLSLLADGEDTAAISERLRISSATARSHVAAILRKLKAKNRAHAVALAIRMALIQIEL